MEIREGDIYCPWCTDGREAGEGEGLCGAPGCQHENRGGTMDPYRYVEYTAKINLGGVFDDIDELPVSMTKDEVKSRVAERMANELSDLILKRPFDELLSFLEIDFGVFEERT